MGDWSDKIDYEYREYYGHLNEPDREEETEEETEEMSNEEMLDKVLRIYFPHSLFIREVNEASHTKKIIFPDGWLKKPYKGGE